MPAERTLRDAIAQNYYKNLMQNEGVMSDLFKSTTDEKRQKRRTGDAYDAMKDEHDSYIVAIKSLESKGYSVDKLENLKKLQIDLYHNRSQIHCKIQRAKSDLKICANIV